MQAFVLLAPRLTACRQHAGNECVATLIIIENVAFPSAHALSCAYKLIDSLWTECANERRIIEKKSRVESIGARSR